MKKILYFIALAAVTAFAGCQKVESEDTWSTDPVAPELYAHNDILLTTGTTEEDVIFSWSAYRNMPEGLDYQFYMQYGETVVSLYNGKDNYYKTDKESFRNLILGSFSDLPENDTFALQFYVTVSNEGTVFESNTIVVNVYAYGDGVAPVITLASESVTLDPADPTAEIVLITWEPARLVYGEEVKYNVYLKIADPAGSAPRGTKAVDSGAYTLAEGLTETSYSTTTDALNEAIVAAGGQEDADNEVTFIVEAYCESLPGGVDATSAVMNVTTYVSTFPDVLYVPGNLASAWWNPAESPTLKQSSTVKGYYEGIVDLTSQDGGNAEFKFCIVPDWGGDFGGSVTVGGKDGVYVSAEGTVGASDNIVVPSGVYVIMLNKKLNTLKMVSISSVGIIGTAVGGWDAEIPMTWDTETNTFTVESAISEGKYKFRLNDDWDYSIDDTYGVNGGGGDLENTYSGNYRITLDMSSHPYKVKFANTEYPESVYLPGSHNGWGWTTSLSGDGEGKYEGFANTGGEWGFKVTSGPGWSGDGYTEWGLDSVLSSGNGTTVYSIKQGGGNIAEGSDIVYGRVTVDLAELTVTVDEITSVGVIGSFSDNSWSSDKYPMEYNADSDSWVVKDVEIIKGVQWKFRMNEAWTINLGGDLNDLYQDGGNITEEEGARYDIELFISTKPYHATLTKTGESDYIDYDAGPWSIIGTVGGTNWDTDFDMEKDGTVFVAKEIAIEAGQAFKIRFDHGWSYNYGADSEDNPFTATIGTAFALKNGGSDITVSESGSYDIYYDTATTTMTIVKAGTVLEDVWSLIGTLGGTNWNTDYDMEKGEEGLYKATFRFSAGELFKIRLNHDWGENYGASSVTVGAPAQGVFDGGNITISDDGTYDVYFDDATHKIYVMPEGIPVMSLIGTIEGTTWDTDFDMTYGYDETGNAVYSYSGITLAEGNSFKVRRNHAWKYDLGIGDGQDNPFTFTENGITLTVKAGGPDFQLGDGAVANIKVVSPFTDNTTIVISKAE